MSLSPGIHPGTTDRGIKQIEVMGIADRTTISDLKGLSCMTPSVKLHAGSIDAMQRKDERRPK